LNLSYCTGIADVSALSGVHELNLYRCKGIRDVSALSRVHILNISHVVADFSKLTYVRNLYS
jgi:hypothetical protein